MVIPLDFQLEGDAGLLQKVSLDIGCGNLVSRPEMDSNELALKRENEPIEREIPVCSMLRFYCCATRKYMYMYEDTLKTDSRLNSLPPKVSCKKVVYFGLVKSCFPVRIGNHDTGLITCDTVFVI